MPVSSEVELEFRRNLALSDSEVRYRYPYTIKRLHKIRSYRRPRAFRKKSRLGRDSYSRSVNISYNDIYGNLLSTNLTVDQRSFFQISSSNNNLNEWHDYEHQIDHIIAAPFYGSDCGVVVNGGIASIACTGVPMNVISQGTAPGYTFSIDDDLEREVLEKALRTLSESKASLGEFYFEREKTYAMIKKRVDDIHRCVLFLRRGNVAAAVSSIGQKHLFDLWKDASNIWLEAKYGWIPLMSDCLGAAEFIFDKYSGISKSHKHRASKQVKLEKTNRSGDTLPGHYYSQTKISGYKKCSVVIDGYVSNPLASDANSLGLANPVNLAWNLLPLSFVVDWFVNVDEFLGQFSRDFGLTINRISITHSAKWGESYFCSRTRSGNTGISYGGIGARSVDIKKRRITTSIPTYPLRLGNFLNNIITQGEFDLKKSISGLALAIQRIR